MVGKTVWDDIRKFGKPIVVVGDPFQLEPIGEATSTALQPANITFTNVFRQALDSPIISYATDIRSGGDFSTHRSMPGLQVSDPSIVWDDLDWADVVICGFNRTRVKVNETLRRKYGFKRLIEEGETLTCLANDPTLGLNNGQSLYVRRILDQKGIGENMTVKINALIDDGTTRILEVTAKGLGREQKLDWKLVRNYLGKQLLVDYGYGITGHRAQGSQWSKVAILHQPCRLWSERRALYTSATRAVDGLRIGV
jgi:exodeoxyribonuclease-5